MTVSKSIKKLIIQGFVTRVEHAADTRAKWISLSEDGKALVQQIIPIVEHTDAPFFETVPKLEQQTFIRIVNQLVTIHRK